MSATYDLAASIVAGDAELPSNPDGVAAFWHGYVAACRRYVRPGRKKQYRCNSGSCKPFRHVFRVGEPYYVLPKDGGRTVCQRCARSFVQWRLVEAQRAAPEATP